MKVHGYELERSIPNALFWYVELWAFFDVNSTVADDGVFPGMMMQGSNASKENVRLPVFRIILHLNNLHIALLARLSRSE